MSRARFAKPVESKLGNRFPKRHPSKFLPSIIWIDWPHYGPVGAKKLRPFLKSARRKEAKQAWDIERDSY